jgi:hypothetical protein
MIYYGVPRACLYQSLETNEEMRRKRYGNLLYRGYVTCAGANEDRDAIINRKKTELLVRKTNKEQRSQSRRSSGASTRIKARQSISQTCHEDHPQAGDSETELP